MRGRPNHSTAEPSKNPIERATTSEMPRNVTEAAKVPDGVAKRITGVATAAKSLANTSTDLRVRVSQFKTEFNGHQRRAA